MRNAAQRRRWHADLATGRRGEDIAHRFLQKQGYTIVARNFRTLSGAGETDIVARKGSRLVFVEVKTRRSAEFGPPNRAIGRVKEIAMLRAARDYCARAGIDPAQTRFDVIGVVLGTPVEIRHFENRTIKGW